ncbi:MAG: NarK/NasA family nitrate transporter [Chloroflexi bacterium]|nr:NarK/NasA family nitrate transporter [Chloroflexota bacterium]
MLWVTLGALGIFIAESLGLSAAQKGLLVAVPILSGATLRVPLGLLGDRIGGRTVGIAMLAFLFLPLALGWRAGEGLPQLLGIGLMLGTAGASFAVALPLASRWYPAERQGLVMGIAAAGNSGTVVANLLAPRLAGVFGWHNVLGLAMVPLALVLVAFFCLAKDSPNRGAGRPSGHYLAALKRGDLWWFCLFYSVTFGGYVGLSSFLPLFLRDQYGVAPQTAGYLTALVAFAGSSIRPLGGYLADRLGGVRVLSLLLIAIGIFYALGARLPTLAVMMGLLVGLVACLGMGNGAVFQLVPQRFRDEIGVATGMVGAVGGLGGFLLPLLLGSVKQAGGSFGPGFLALGLASLAAAALLGLLAAGRRSWRSSWRPAPTAESPREPAT